MTAVPSWAPEYEHCYIKFLPVVVYKLRSYERVFPVCSASMGTIYAENKDEDGFLYVAYSGENTFGLWSSFTANTCVCF